VVNEVLQVVERYTVRPAHTGKFVRPPDPVEPLIQVVQVLLGKIHAK
jgi:hypothetical protein